MALYRVHRNIRFGNYLITRGSLETLAGISERQIEKLLYVGAISRVAPPPLSEIPGWTARAGRLADVGIINVEQFLEADPDLIARQCKVKRATVEGWRMLLENWLQAPSQAGG